MVLADCTSPHKAGGGNRTLVIGLEDRCSTIELHPRPPTFQAPCSRRREHRFLGVLGWGCWLRIGQSRIRTCVGLSPPDLQSGAIGRSAICPNQIVNPVPANGRTGIPDFFSDEGIVSSSAACLFACWSGQWFRLGKLAVGLEPTTSGLQNQCSALELR